MQEDERKIVPESFQSLIILLPLLYISGQETGLRPEGLTLAALSICSPLFNQSLSLCICLAEARCNSIVKFKVKLKAVTLHAVTIYCRPSFNS